MELHQISGSQPSLAMTLDTTNAAEASFTQRYFLAGGDPHFTKDFSVSWTDFATAVQQIMDATLFPAELLMLQFIHRFDATSKTWFLTMSGARRSVDSIGTVGGNKLYNMMPADLRFDLTQGTVAPSSFTGMYDDVYFKNLYYKYDTGALVQLITDTSHVKFASCVSLPWLKELSRVFSDNAVDPVANDVQMKFSCVASDYQAQSVYSNIEFPHAVAFYLNVNGENCLDNNVYAEAPFKMKAADMQTYNPPYNSQYIWPNSLTTLCGGPDDHGYGHGNGDDDCGDNGHHHGGHDDVKIDVHISHSDNSDNN